MLMLMLLLMLLLRSAAPLPFDGSLALTRQEPPACILAVRTGANTDSPPAPANVVAYAAASMPLTHR